MSLSIFFPLLGLTSLLFATGCRPPAAEPETVSPQTVDRADDGAYRLQSPRGELALSVKWEQEHWWIRLTEDDRVSIPWTRVSPFEFPHGQYLETTDLNQDGQPDFLFTDYGGGVGIMATYRHLVVLLSRKDGYDLQVVADYQREDLVRTDPQGGKMLVLSRLVQQDTGSGGFERNRYWVVLPLRLRGNQLEPVRHGIPGLPRAEPVDPDTPPLSADDPEFPSVWEDALGNLFWKPETF